MVGALIGAGAQIASAIGGAIAGSKAGKKARAYLESRRNKNNKWYEQDMNTDYTQRADTQNILRKDRDLALEQMQRARAINIVAGGTDESLALQQAGINERLGETKANIAAMSANYREAAEQRYRNEEMAINQQEMALEQQKAQNIATAAGQMGSAVSGLVQGGMDATKKPVDEDVTKVTV